VPGSASAGRLQQQDPLANIPRCTAYCVSLSLRLVGLDDKTRAEAEEIFRGIVAAVATAHAAGLVHRDLKPANVLMARRGERWIPKVTDFGLAKETNADPSLTGHGATMGTPGYMAPEQIRNSADVDERADIFALGCLLFQLLSGEQPHPGDDPFAIMNAVAAGRVARIERLVPGLPPRFYRTVRRAMALDPEQRPRTCDQLLTLLDPPRPTALVQQPPSGPSWMSLLALAMVLPLIGSLVLLGPLFEIARPSPPVPARAQLAPQPILPAVAQPPRAPEPWVADDVDVAWLMPVLPVAAEPTPDAPRSTAVRAKPAARPGSSVCGSGWAPLPWYARSPDEGAWALRRDLDVHEGTPDEPGAVACVLPEGSIVEVEGGIVRGQSGRWIRLASVSAP